MQKKHIELFGVDTETGLNILADAVIYAVDALSCKNCGIVHHVSAKPIIDTILAYPGTDEERLFLAFAMSDLAHLDGFLGAASLILRFGREHQSTRDELTYMVRRALEELVLRDMGEGTKQAADE